MIVLLRFFSCVTPSWVSWWSANRRTLGSRASYPLNSDVYAGKIVLLQIWKWRAILPCRGVCVVAVGNMAAPGVWGLLKIFSLDIYFAVFSHVRWVTMHQSSAAVYTRILRSAYLAVHVFSVPGTGEATVSLGWSFWYSSRPWHGLLVVEGVEISCKQVGESRTSLE